METVLYDMHVQVRFINLIPMHFFHKSLHTPYCFSASPGK